MGSTPDDRLARRVYVGSLDYSLTEEHIRLPFSAFGNILKIDMPKVRISAFCFPCLFPPSFFLSVRLALALLVACLCGTLALRSHVHAGGNWQVKGFLFC